MNIHYVWEVYVLNMVYVSQKESVPLQMLCHVELAEQ